MTDHPNEDEIGRCFRGESLEIWQTVLAHLEAGCEVCLRVSEPWLAVALQEAAAEDDYDEVIDRVYASIRRQMPRIQAERERLDEALATPAILDAALSAKPPRNALRGWPLVIALLHRSFDLRYRDSVEMCRFSFVAYTAACQLDEARYGSRIVSDVRARAAAELANAYRVRERYRESARLFAEADRHCADGTGDLLLLARILELKASLATAERRFEDAVRDLASAHDLYEQMGDRHMAGRALVKAGIFEDYAGRSREALALLQRGFERLDPDHDRRLYTTTQLSLLDTSLACGEYQPAARLLFASGLRQAFAAEPLNLLKLRWVEGKIFAGLGRLDRAEQAFAAVRVGFEEQLLPYNSAVAGLDLLAVYLRQHRLAEVVALAAKILEVFERLSIGREALRAAEYLELACREGLITLAAVQHVARFLSRFERDPSLVFAVP